MRNLSNACNGACKRGLALTSAAMAPIFYSLFITLELQYINCTDGMKKAVPIVPAREPERWMAPNRPVKCGSVHIYKSFRCSLQDRLSYMNYSVPKQV